MVKRLIAVVVVILVLAVVSEVLLPAAVSRIVAQGMMSRTGSDSVNVAVTKRPAVMMLTGSFDKIAVNAADARMDKLTFSELNATLTNVQLDMSTLVTRRLLAIKSVETAEVTAVITEAELARSLNQTVKGIKNASVVVMPGKVVATSLFSVGGFANLSVTLEGKIAVDSQKIKFVTEKFLLNNSLVGNIGGTALTEIPLLELKKLPFDVTVREIVMDKGKVTIYADNRK